MGVGGRALYRHLPPHFIFSFALGCIQVHPPPYYTYCLSRNLISLQCVDKVLRPSGMDLEKRKMLRRNLTPTYPFGGPTRFPVMDDKISWEVRWADYHPPDFTLPGILMGDKPWADKKIGAEGFTPNFNSLDGALDRRSWEGKYKVEEGVPLNPVGRTGLKGRGSLGKWGPNHAADAIVTRWKVDDKTGQVVFNELNDSAPVLQFIAIRRGDSGAIAIPGGMVDPGETHAQAAQREFIEEVIGVDDQSTIDQELKQDLERLFSNCKVVDKTYVDDPRNTDNAWIETYAVNFHIPHNLTLSHLSTMAFKSGSDAKEAFWIDYHPHMKLYASHNSLIKKAVSMLLEGWKTQNQ